MQIGSFRHAVVPVLAAVMMCSGAGPALAQTTAAPRKVAAFEQWPAGASPEEVGKRIAENYAARPIERWDTGFVIYPEVCTWYGSLTFAALSGNKDLQKRLIARFDPLLTEAGAKRISPEAHVDFRVFGAVPLEIYLANKDPRVLEIGKGLADKQWDTTTADGITTEARYWIDDMYMITAVQVQAYRATGDSKYLDRAAKAMVAYLDKLQQPNGLFFHAPDSQFYWGRGNGWMAAGFAELLRALPESHPNRARVMQGYRTMMASLLKYQAEDGMWRQLIDDPAVVARDVEHGDVHLRDGHRREERMAGREDVRPRGAQGVARAGQVHRRAGQHARGVRRHEQGADSAVPTSIVPASSATSTDRRRWCGPRRRF